MKSRPVLIVAVLTALANAQTPVIGGGCAMGTQDVQIGGKQTQFFLKCEPTSESPSGEGVWVVKSRAAAAAAAPAPIPLENTQPQHRPKIMHKQPNICEQDLVAREGASCAVSTTCLQAHNEMPSSYLQCEQSKMIWHRRDCHEGTIFNFEQQACIVPKRVHSLSRCSGCVEASSCPSGCYPYVGPGPVIGSGASSAPTPTNYNIRSGAYPIGSGASSSSYNIVPLPSSNNIVNVPFPSSTNIGNGAFPSSYTIGNGAYPSSYNIGSGAYPTYSISSGPFPNRVRRAASDANITISPCQPSCAPCTGDQNCPRDFKCRGGCCRLQVCPGKRATPSGDCSQDNQCRKTEQCLFGACCPRFTKTRKPKLGKGSVISEGRINKAQIKEAYEKRLLANLYPLSAEVLEWEKSQPSTTKKPWISFMTTTTTESPFPTPKMLFAEDALVSSTTAPNVMMAKDIEAYFGLQPSKTLTSTTTTTLAPSTQPPDLLAELSEILKKKKFRDDFQGLPEGFIRQEKEVDLNGNEIAEQEDEEEDSCIPLLEHSRQCSLKDPCPTEADCIDGRCCRRKNPPSTCPSALSFPSKCSANEDCPIGSKCLGSVCCPLSDGESNETRDEALLEANEQDLQNLLASQTFEARKCKSGNESLSTPAFCESHKECPPTHYCELAKCCPSTLDCPPIPSIARDVGVAFSRGAPTSKPRCLSAVSCNSTSTDDHGFLCPPGFTCTLAGTCCRLQAFCPSDGMPPESLCNDLCPSSSQSCVKLPGLPGGARACCTSPASSIEIEEKGQVSNSGLVCTYSSCSNNNPCNVGSCNNGYCCSSSSSIQTRRRKPKKRLKAASTGGGEAQASASSFPITLERALERAITSSTESPSTQPTEAAIATTASSITTTTPDIVANTSDDWPVGPPGYGFPAAIADLDSILIPATGDGTTCAAGFRSTLQCYDGACPPGLFCDTAIQRCCPLLLPLSGRGFAVAPPLSTTTTTTTPAPPIPIRVTRAPFPAIPPYLWNLWNRVTQTPLQLRPPEDPKPVVPHLHHHRPPQAKPAIPFPSTYNFSFPDGKGIRIVSVRDGVSSSTFVATTARPVIVGQPMRRYQQAQIMSTGSSNCIGCGASPQVVQIPQIAVAVCPNGGYSSGSCGYGNSCNSGYSCNQGSCCPTYQAQAVTFTCPGGGSPVGSCVNGGCASGYSCSSNYCCASSNPFVCIDGTQAVGSCVNGVCGTGYTCNSGLCCSTTSATPRCLDGSPAVGACIPSCTGDMCGGVTVTYSCGSGYTCTTGNICCQTSACPLGGTPIGPPVNGLCPGGYTLQGNQCCGTANQCTNGGTYVGELINGLCPPGSVANNGVCCTSAITCDAAASNGPCLPNQALSCSVGYQCDTTGQLCCPILTNIDPNTVDSIGPALFGCPLGYFAITFAGGDPSGECVNVQSLPGICTAAQQIGPCNVADATCPAGFECHLASQTCCQPGTFTNTAAALAFRSHPGGRFGRPVSHLMPPRTMGTHGCPDGSPAASACINGLCGAGLSCLNDLCCAVNEPVNVPKSSCPDGTPAVSGCFADGLCGGGLVCVPGSRLCCPASSVPTTPAPAFPYGQSAFMKARPIGARCDSDQHCVGFTDGLSHCEFGTCRCTPIAYAQGIACVRRKKL